MRLGNVRSYAGALGEPQFRLLFFGRSFSVLGSSLITVALAFAVLDLTGSASDLGFVLAARSIPLIALLLVGGVWADRLPRNVVMLSTDVVRFALQCLVGVLLLTDRAELWHLVVAMAVSGAADAFFNPASTGIVPHTVSAERLQQANGLLGMATSSLNTLGPAVAGVLVAAAGPGWAFVADGATYAISAAFLARMTLPRAARLTEAPTFLADLRTGFREFWRQRWMVVIDAWAIVANMTVIAGFLVLGPLVADRDLDGPTSWGLIAGGFGLGAFLGEAAAVAVRPRRPLVLGCTVLATFAAPLAALAVPAPTLVIAAAAAVAGGGLTLFNTLFITTAQQEIPDEALSRVMAYDWLASVGFMPIGFAIVGPLAGALGVAEVLLAFAALHLALTAAILPLPAVRGIVRDVRGDDPREKPPDVPAAPEVVDAR